MSLEPFGAYAEFYDLDLAGMDDDLPMLEGFAARCGSPILELGCGTGRLLLPLAGRGYRLTGVDHSSEMLALARQKVAAAGLGDRVELVEQDLLDLDLGDRFNLVFAAINTFSYFLTIDDQLAVLERVLAHLEPGGVLLLDLFNPDLTRLMATGEEVCLAKTMLHPDTGHTLVKFRVDRPDLARQVIDVTYLLDDVDEAGGVRRRMFAFAMRYMFRHELELLLRCAGFEVEAIYGSYDLDEFEGDSEKLIAIARRPA